MEDKGKLGSHESLEIAFFEILVGQSDLARCRHIVLIDVFEEVFAAILRFSLDVFQVSDDHCSEGRVSPVYGGFLIELPSALNGLLGRLSIHVPLRSGDIPAVSQRDGQAYHVRVVTDRLALFLKGLLVDLAQPCLAASFKLHVILCERHFRSV